MGCGGSKVDDLQVVALCRDRSRLLADAIRARRVLVDAQAAYARSLRSVGGALSAFLDALGDGAAAPSGSPVLPLPTRRKAQPSPPPSPPPAAAAHHLHSRSHSGSHINFHSSCSESESEYESESESEPVSPFHSSGSSPLHHAEGVGPTHVNLNYARSRPAASSVAFEQRPQSSEPVHHFGGAAETSISDAYPYYGYPYPTQNYDSYPYSYSSDPYLYPYPPPGYSAYGGMNGFFGSSFPPPAEPARQATRRESPSTRAPPPPPSPPRASAWDFLNPFDSSDSYYVPYNATYTPSRSSREVREEEGIPDLEEEEEDGHEVVKKAYSEHRKFATSVATAAGDHLRESSTSSATDDEAEIHGTEEGPHYPMGPGSVAMEHNTHVVDKNVVTGDVEPLEGQPNVAAPHKQRDASEVVEDIEVQFNRASESTDEVLRILQSVHKVPPRMMSGVPPPPTSGSDDFSDFEDKKMGSRNLSKTLQKLYMWEKKLHEEVRAEEKMRLLHDKYCKRLKHLDQKGAEAQKIEATQAMIRKLSTRIRIAIQVVDSISNRINKLRDEDLWPQICEFIQGLMRMWRVMVECHRTQFQAILESKILDSKSFGGKLSDACMEASKGLELEMLEWVGNFSAWINAQRSYVKVMNGWLLKCINCEPEETPDGIAPFSPGRLGAPPVFIICNYWSQAMDRISEREVVESMRSFAADVLQVWQRHHFERRQRVMANGDMDTALKILEKEEQQMRRTVDAQSKKLVLVSGQSGVSLYGEVVYRGHKDEVSSLQISLRGIFESMESFTSSVTKAYEELYVRSEKERLARGNAKVP